MFPICFFLYIEFVQGHSIGANARERFMRSLLLWRREGLNHSRRIVWECVALRSAVGSRARHAQGMPACRSIP